MRLRLSVQRHKLPSTEVLWSVANDQAQQAFTIAKLLEEVNHIIPLESDHWGLEDYVVEVGGFECLHFSPVADILKDEDRVCIRSIQTSEVRSRTLCGRVQINAGGQHLVDGVPFGRPYLRRPMRPAVSIPPPKARRLLTHGEVGGDEEDDATEGHEAFDSVGIIPYHWKTRLEVEDDEEDSDFKPNDCIDGDETDSPRVGKRVKSVRFEEPLANQAMMQFGDSEEEDEDFQFEEDVNMSDESTEESSEAESDTSSDLSDSSVVSSDSEDSDTSSDSDSDSSVSDESAASSAPEVLSSKPSRPPKTGKSDTIERNRRRRDSRRLHKLKSCGILPRSAQFQDLRKWAEQSIEEQDFAVARSRIPKGATDLGRLKKKWQKQKAQHRGGTEIAKAPASNASISRSGLTHRGLASDVSGCYSRIAKFPDGDTIPENEVTVETSEVPGVSLSAQATIQEQDEFNRRRQELLAAIESGGIDVTPPKRPEKRKSVPSEEATDSAVTNDDFQKKSSSEESAKPASKRARLDLGAARRTIFYGLGERTPKNKVDEAKLKAKLMAVGKAPVKSKPAVEEREATPEPTDPDEWETKINLTAFECWDEDIELSAPPFPFKQHWDPQSKEMSKRRKKKKQKNVQYYHEDALAEAEKPVQLNYDDEVEDTTTDKMDVDSAIQSQLRQEVGTTTPDLPLPPADLSTLPPLTRDDVKVGAIIVFNRWVCSIENNFNPEIVGPTTAIVEIEQTEASTIGLRLAQRDQPRKQKKYDAKGNRVYEKFEPVDDSDDEDEASAGLIYEEFEELLDARLLRAATSSRAMSVESSNGVQANTDDASGIPLDAPPAYEGLALPENASNPPEGGNGDTSNNEEMMLVQA
ncbi:hypothetical protein K469DRAFT_278077 [Zopfia rhizophila CBS 207.26]|uniref:DUF7357 domain-containing protein n=1 Tax=Zopfia rhizophila CBS 207.26 TaxID=1314779 RepID=A0A6A6DRV0_9PEZI|nr:hypothetical protein K469DRAFT_278077 [Zopfia rhizophila CBS 207.26]